MPETEKALRMLIRESGIETESEEATRLLDYLALLTKWNLRINLASSTEWDVVGPLFREGIWASTLYPDSAASHLDIGSGAGFPAIPLKILKPAISLDLVESRAKKGIFLETAADALGLRGVRVHSMRLLDFLRREEAHGFWDCISWKALKLGSKDLEMLLAHAGPGTQFWMFHGSEPAVEEPCFLDRNFAAYRTERFPGRKLWSLSVYLPK